MIVIEVSDLRGRQVISAGGGIWAGMSGSPVYIDGKLLGAVGLRLLLASPSTIGGVTPAADMLDLLHLPPPRTSPADRHPCRRGQDVSLSTADRRAIEARAEAQVPAGSLQPLTLPMSVSGLTASRLQRFQAKAKKADLPLLAYAGSRPAAPAATAALARPEAGRQLRRRAVLRGPDRGGRWHHDGGLRRPGAGLRPSVPVHRFLGATEPTTRTRWQSSRTARSARSSWPAWGRRSVPSTRTGVPASAPTSAGSRC